MATMTVVGVFNDLRQAERCVEDLRAAGFREDQIGVLVRDAGEPGDDRPSDLVYNTEEGAINGAVTGTIAGGLLGGLAALTIPGLGVVLASALAAGILTGATAGAAAGGILGALVGLGVPEDEAHRYEAELHAGRVLVTVRSDDQGDAARDVLHRHGGVDLATA